MRTRRVLAGLLTGAAAMLALLLVPVAWAGAAEAGAATVTESTAIAPSGPTGSAQPIALAHTGLDLTIPVLVGLGIFAAGTLLVAWAVLRGSRSRHAGG
ncbi:MAG TPA: hypothetical protein VFM01_01680 [Nakamurella sp.]|jgi:hypothetical protein|nr:hypothetical protein [Nakamurella sp.]